MKISPRDRLILTGVVLAIVALLAGALLIVPQVQQLQSLSADAEQANKDYQEAKALLQQRQDMKDNAAATDTEYLRLANQVPESPELPSLIIELQDNALQAGVKFESLRPADPQSSLDTQQSDASAETAPTQGGEEYVVIPLTMGVQGTWSDTIDFMSRLQKMTRALRTVEFSSGTDTPGGAESEDITSDAVNEFTNFKLEAYCYPTTQSVQ
jgi:Tfp pilus assembly protein PilO